MTGALLEAIVPIDNPLDLDATAIQNLTGPVGFASGTAAAPGAAFSASPTTGWFRDAADAIGFSIAGTERWVDSNSGGNPLRTITGSTSWIVTKESQTLGAGGAVIFETPATGTSRLNNQAFLMRSLAAGRAVTFQFSDTATNAYASMVGNLLYFRVGAANTGQFLFEDGSGKNMFTMNTVTSSVNWGTVTGSVTTEAVEFGVAGTDTDIDLHLVPKGAGNLRLDASESAGTATVARTIPINIGGTVRHVMLADSAAA